MTRITLNDQLPLEIREKLERLKKALNPPADKPIIIQPGGKKSARLSGNSPISELPLIDKENQKKAKDRFFAAKTWLEETFPKAFNFKDPKPLKLSIEHDLFQVESPFSRSLIRKVIAC